jgi:cytochrome c biogenesis protein|uniref:Cytochrome c biogenesis protein CcsB n=1 Tax=Poterioochromonas malhamensis TaxID=88167 RepID=A0A7T6Y7Q5_9STRA|nr:ATP cytochrome c biogenesis protein [Poterioochromonas malhamensis]YP_010139413.1 c-type cytochrome biogenesis protein [Poterioochromonas malhamensis]QQK54962.1 ATP cytochrome c biogenesis protein [Poterioochromonas malhamensis]QQK55079.1 c-type cytochrome biogenesis protein [Poterioochromonas malhamensis]
MNYFFLLKFFNKLNFAIFLLLMIALISSLGSFIEQNETIGFYKQMYPKNNSFFDYNFIFFFKLNEIYTSWWFLALISLLVVSLVSCSITTQFPIVSNAKLSLFKRKKFFSLPFFVKVKNNYYLKEQFLVRLHRSNYLFYQKKRFVYSYKGLLGRISPILVHVSLISLLLSSSLGAFLNIKAEQLYPKGEISHVQNFLQLGKFTKISPRVIRCNDFWIQYHKKKIFQFYSNFSLLTNYGVEIKEKTLSVNKPLFFKNLDIYQTDWNLAGLRIFSSITNKTYQYPLFFTNIEPKIWITWINFQQKNYTVICNRFFSDYFLYDEAGNFLEKKKIGKEIMNNSFLLEIIYSTGLLIKENPTISLVYFAFFGLMITTVLSYFPYNQLWLTTKSTNVWIGAISNRGKIGFEVELENFLRDFFLKNTRKKFWKNKKFL